MSISSLANQRDQVLEQMRSLDRMRRGSLSRQYLKAAKDKPPQGPYFVLQGYLRGQKFSERIPADRAAQTELDVENYRSFQQLCERFVTLTDQMTQLADEESPESKKNSRPRKSPKNISGKRTPS